MNKKVVILIVAIAASARLALAQEPPFPPVEPLPGWHKVGEMKADFEKESESIALLGANDIFKSIKFKVTEAPISIDKVIVFYENKEMQEIPLSGMMQVDTESKGFDLLYPSEEIKKVSFTYKSEPNYRGKKAHVELYGLRQ
jgi:hypothetical protein